MPRREFGHVVIIKPLSKIPISSLMGLSAGMTWDARYSLVRDSTEGLMMIDSIDSIHSFKIEYWVQLQLNSTN
jgi:hypothetical protein